MSAAATTVFNDRQGPANRVPQEIAMHTYSIRYRDACGRWSVAYAQATSQSDAEAIATCRYGTFHSVSRAGFVS